MLTRRQFSSSLFAGGLSAGAGLLAGCTTTTAGGQSINGASKVDEEGYVVETYVLENGEIQTLRFRPQEINELGASPMASLEPRIEDFGARFITVCERYIGLTRDSDFEKISLFMALQRLDLRTNAYFCAAGLTYAAAMVYAEEYDSVPQNEAQQLLILRKYLPEVRQYHFRPHVSVLNMSQSAEGGRRLYRPQDLGSRTPQPGWITLYQFGSGGFDHCGVITDYRKADGECHTIEFNTSSTAGTGSDQRISGTIARKVRRLSLIKAYIATSQKEFPTDLSEASAFIGRGR